MLIKQYAAPFEECSCISDLRLLSASLSQRVHQQCLITQVGALFNERRETRDIA